MLRPTGRRSGAGALSAAAPDSGEGVPQVDQGAPRRKSCHAAETRVFQEKAQAWVKDVLLKARPAVAQRPLLQLARAVCCAKRTRSGLEVVV